MKIVFVNRFFYPDESATSQLLTDLAFHLAEIGHDVHVVCSRQLYETPKALLAANETVRGVSIQRIRTSRFGRATLLGRVFDYLSFYVAGTARLFAMTDENTVVVSKTDPPLLSIPASLVVRYKKALLVNWLQDLFPEVAIVLGVSGLDGHLGNWLVKLRNSSLKLARMNVVLGERMANRVRAAGVNDDQLFVIPNWTDDGVIRPICGSQNPLSKEWKLDGRFVVMYSGNMGRAHEFETILGTAALLQHDQRFLFLFVGGGNQRARIARQADALGLKNVVFLPYQPRERLAFSLSVASVHLISLRPALEGLIVPSKFYGILAAGRPVIFIGSDDGEIAMKVRQGNCGFVVREGDVTRLRECLTGLADAEALRRSMGENGRSFLDKNFSRAVAFRAWEAVLRRLSTSGILQSASRL